MLTRRALFTGALAMLLAPPDLLPQRKLWALGGLPGWTSGSVDNAQMAVSYSLRMSPDITIGVYVSDDNGTWRRIKDVVRRGDVVSFPSPSERWLRIIVNERSAAGMIVV